MLHNEARELLVQGYETTHDAEGIVKAYSVSQRTVYRLPQTTTILSSIRFDGEKAFATYQGGTTGERFVQYLKETLLPTLRPGDIVVMDNMRSHHVKAVRGRGPLQLAAKSRRGKSV